jgi:tetratricopeptide (TPR) repeat protein
MALVMSLTNGGETGRALEALLALPRPTTDDFRQMFELVQSQSVESPSEAEERLNRIAELAAGSGEPAAVCLAHQKISEILRDRGDYPGSIAHAEEVLKAARQCGELRFEGSYHFLIGRIAECKGRYDEARDAYERCFATYRALGHALGQRAALNQLANVATVRGAPGDAVADYQRCLDLCDEATPDDERASYVSNIGHALLS